jgi:hypothetical protein
MIQQAFAHHGIIGKSRDPCTSQTALLHLLSQGRHKLIAQCFPEMPHKLVQEKTQQISKCVTEHLCGNYIPPLCHSVKRLNKDLSELTIYYNTFGLLGESLENALSRARKDGRAMTLPAVRKLVRDLLSCLSLVTRFTNEYSNFSPHNIFFKEDTPYVNNFSLDFTQSNYNKTYGCPGDRVMVKSSSELTTDDYLNSAIFTIGQIALEALTLCNSQDIYSGGTVDEGVLAKLVKKAPLEMQGLLQGMLVEEEGRRTPLQELLAAKELEWPAEVSSKKEGMLKMKTREGMTGFSEVIYSDLMAYRGNLQAGLRRGYGMLQHAGFLALGLFNAKEELD